MLATSQSAALPNLLGVECECALSGVFFLHSHTGPPITILDRAFAIPCPAQPTPESLQHCNMHATPSVKGLAFWGGGQSVCDPTCAREKILFFSSHMRPPFKKLETRFDAPFSASLNPGPVIGAACLQHPNPLPFLACGGSSVSVR